MSVFHVRRIQASDTYNIRHVVLRPNLDLEACKFKEDNIPETFHLGVFDGEKLVCIGSFAPDMNTHFDPAKKQFRLRGMATLPLYRGKGAGRALMISAFHVLKSLGVQILWCNARIVAVNFYKKLGLSIIGDEFIIDGVGPHFVMWKAVT